MQQCTKNVGREAGGRAELIRVLNQWVACLKVRGDSAGIEERVKELLRDAREVTQARIRAAKADRVQFALGMLKMGDDAIEEALKREDLTIAEGLKLYQAINEQVRRITDNALREKRCREQDSKLA